MRNIIEGILLSSSAPKKTNQKTNKKTLESNPELAAFYKEKIAPYTSFAEESRVKHLKKFYFRLKLSIPLCLVLVYLISMYFPTNFSDRNSADIVLLPFFLLGFWCYSAIMSFNSSIKSKIYSEIFKFFGDFKYNHKGHGIAGISAKKKFGIIPSFSSSKTEDLIIGQYSGVSINFEEWRLIRGGGKHKTTVFEGATLLLSFNKNFLGKTIVRRDKGKIANFATKFVSSESRDLEKVSFEDPEFEKRFEVYSNDQIEARYLITPAFMDRLLGLTRFFEADSVSAGFADNSLFIMFDGSTNLFEVGSIFKEMDLAEDSIRLHQQMKLIFELIDYLKINQRTGI